MKDEMNSSKSPSGSTKKTRRDVAADQQPPDKNDCCKQNEISDDHDRVNVSNTLLSTKKDESRKINFDKKSEKNGPKSSSQMLTKAEDSSKTSSSLFMKSWFSHDSKPLTFEIKFDAAAILIFICAAITRMWRLDQPKGIVFDELHYGKSISLYMKQTFFFDTYPPLGKQLIALAGYAANFDGNVEFSGIGGVYPSHMPLRALRFVPALFGSLLAPTVYYLIIEMGLTHRTAILAGVIIILENSLLTQSRFILMESMLLWFSAFGVLCYLKFRQKTVRPFGFSWWMWLMLCSVCLTCAIWCVEKFI